MQACQYLATHYLRWNRVMDNTTTALRLHGVQTAWVTWSALVNYRMAYSYTLQLHKCAARP